MFRSKGIFLLAAALALVLSACVMGAPAAVPAE
jgi:hypothetical protein